MSNRINIGAAISIKVDCETRTRESRTRLSQITPGCRTRAYSPVVISLSLTPVVIYVLRKGRLIKREYISNMKDIESSTQPGQADHAGKSNSFDWNDSITNAYTRRPTPRVQIMGLAHGTLFMETISKTCITRKPRDPIAI